MSSLFNLEDLSDIPETLRKELCLLSATDEKILALFAVRDILNISEAIVGYYRMYGVEKKRQYMMTTLYRMKKKGLLVPTKNKGEYRCDD